ncbi:MAG: hypothetical protein FWD66_07750 [Paludibacter sp.]|nr:hypothetical protein [Paludibacter sp.]
MAKFENPILLEEMIARRFINVQKHPEFPLWLYNYSKRAQHFDVWNEATCACRGMILNYKMNIVSRPFRKFFSYQEVVPQILPHGKFTVTEKIDGSLGISYWYAGNWHIATRGSFTGKQAIRANRILHQKYEVNLPKMKSEYTYLFEIIYPENSIIVDYGQREELVLLAVIDTDTGNEIFDFENLTFSKPKIFDGINSFDDVMKLNCNNAEGFVLRFESGERLKIKFEGYKRLHKIMLGITENKVWNYISKDKDLNELYAISGEKYKDWIKCAEEKIRAAYIAKKLEIIEEFCALPNVSQAQKIGIIKESPNYDIMLNLLTNKPIEKLLWQHVKPDENASWFAQRG